MATAAPPTATTLDQSEGSATADLYRAVIGSINTNHFLSLFEHFEAAERPGLRWNWAAALFTLNWLAFRSLWGAALAYTGAIAAAALLVFGIGRLVLELSAQTQWLALAALVLLSFVVPGLWGNAWLYRASRKRMALALAANHTVAEACTMLKRNAPSSARLLGLGLINAMLVAGAVAIYLNLPQGPHLPLHTAPIESKAAEALQASTTGSVIEETASPRPVSLPVTQAASAPAMVASEPQAPAPIPIPEPAGEAAAVVEPAKPEVAEKIAKAIRPAKPAKPAPASTATAAPEKTYLVNAGLFANAGNAQHVRTTLADAGLAVITEEVTGTKGTFTRVRVGPFASREQAVAAVLKIRSLGLEAQVLNPP